jgi:hypothetical protein
MESTLELVRAYDVLDGDTLSRLCSSGHDAMRGLDGVYIARERLEAEYQPDLTVLRPAQAIALRDRGRHSVETLTRLQEEFTSLAIPQDESAESALQLFLADAATWQSRSQTLVETLSTVIDAYPDEPRPVHDLPQQLALLADLHTAGKLTDDEFAQAKAGVLAQLAPRPGQGSTRAE